MTSRRWLAVGAVTAALFLLAGRMLAALYVDYEWYATMHALPLWWAQLLNTILLRGATIIVGGAFVFFNLLAVRRSVVQLVLPRRLGNLEIGEQVPGRYMMAAVVALSVLLGVTLTLVQQDWLALANLRYGDVFNATEGHQAHDYGYYVYWLPFESALYTWALITLLVVAATVIFLYAMTPSLRWERGTLRVSTWVRRHMTVLCVCVLFLLAWSYWLDADSLLVSGSAPDGSYTSIDKHINAPANIALALVTLSLSGVVLWAGWTRQLRIAAGTAITLFALNVLLRHALPAIAPRFMSPRDAIARERTFLAERDQFGHYAFGLDRVRRTDTGLVAPAVLDPERDVPVWDPSAIGRALDRSRRAPRVAGQVGWEPGRDAVNAVVVTMPDQADAGTPLAAWGAVRVRASQGGVIEGSIGGAPRAPDADAMHAVSVAPVLIYDSASGPIVVNDSSVAGGAIRRGFVRLAHAWNLQNPRMLLGETPPAAARIVTRRDVRERVRALVPFLTQSRVVSPILRGDSLYWAIDLYSASASFPLSRHVFTPFGELGYLRHVAVALVQAYTGRVMVVKDSPIDALTEGWARRFPGMFTPADSVPRDLLDALPPQLELLDATTSQFVAVGWRHVHSAPRKPAPGGTGDTAIARGGPALFVVNDSGRRLAASHVVLDSADRMEGIMLAVGGYPAHIWWVPFPEPRVRWPEAVDAMIRAGEPLSPPPNPRIDRPIPGGIQAIPLAGTIWLLQPSYLWPANGPPAVAFVSLWRGGTAQAARDVATVLRTHPGDLPTLPPGPPSAERIAELYNRMRLALKRGDWAAFGAAFEALGRLTGQPPIR